MLTGSVKVYPIATSKFWTHIDKKSKFYCENTTVLIPSILLSGLWVSFFLMSLAYVIIKPRTKPSTKQAEREKTNESVIVITKHSYVGKREEDFDMVYQDHIQNRQKISLGRALD